SLRYASIRRINISRGRLQPARSEAVLIRRDSKPGGRAAVQHVRVDHDPQRQLLQVHQLRDDERLRLIPCGYAREADLRVGLFYFYWLFIDRSQQLDPTLRRHHEENDAA